MPRTRISRASGIEIVFFNNWKEQSLLGRAEWMKFVGMFSGAMYVPRPSSVSSESTSRRRRSLRKSPTSSPSLYGQGHKGSWYVPWRILLRHLDAHRRAHQYDFIPGQVANKPMSFEYASAATATPPVWLSMMVGDDITLKRFLSMNERY